MPAPTKVYFGPARTGLIAAGVSRGAVDALEKIADKLYDAQTAIDLDKAANSTVANLPSAVDLGAGTRRFVTDATVTLTAGIGTTVAGGGANKVPVYSDGAVWKVG